MQTFKKIFPWILGLALVGLFFFVPLVENPISPDCNTVPGEYDENGKWWPNTCQNDKKITLFEYIGLKLN